jgi:hypothetical protein
MFRELSKPLALSLVLAAMASAALPARAQGPATPRVLGATVESGVMPKALDATSGQKRAVRPDLAAIEGLARLHALAKIRSRFVIDLFPGHDVEAEVVEAGVRATGATVFARLVGVELGSAVLTLERGLLTASVDMPSGSFVVEPKPNGTHEVAHKAAERYRPERPPRVAFIPRTKSAPFAARPDAQPDVPVDSGRQIDVMVVWTPLARAVAPQPLPPDDADAHMRNLAQAAVDNANLAYLNSGIAQRLRLVHAQPVDYAERCQPSQVVDCALDDLTGASDGPLDEVHALRDLHGADLVALLVHDYESCGVAWLSLPSTATAHLGFSVIAWDCAVGAKSFVHELGHNMGAHHDAFVVEAGGCGDGKEPGAYCYSRGIVNLAERWRTVMSYNDQCIAIAPYTPCTRIAYFSNPKLGFTGWPLGDASYANNAHTLNKTAKAIAAYRPTSPLHPVPARFADVPVTHPFFGPIEFLAQAGITTGCAAGMFCPDHPASRRAMAAFIERTMRASNWVPPTDASAFTDVAPGSMFAGHIEALRTDGVTSGCSTITYCPESDVTRGQMAVFLLRARCGADYVPAEPVMQTFADVPLSHPFASYIGKLHALGITLGCATGPLRYCPDATVTRAAAAAFLERSYPMLTPSEACTL